MGLDLMHLASYDVGHVPTHLVPSPDVVAEQTLGSLFSGPYAWRAALASQQGNSCSLCCFPRSASASASRARSGRACWLSLILLLLLTLSHTLPRYSRSKLDFTSSHTFFRSYVPTRCSPYHAIIRASYSYFRNKPLRKKNHKRQHAS